jgi:ligand-binding SRPBCC domain-containing protein
MATYDRSVRVFAPFERVWDFHSNERGLEALTPEWMNLTVESVRGPDGEPDPEVLVAGSTLNASVRPFGVGPRQRWTSEITAREHSGGSAYFRDSMSDGPFEHWEHTHLFYEDGETTLVRDHVEYELPTPVGPTVSPLAWVGFEPMFRYRHRKTKELLESGSE